jgi:N-acetylmuramic acid 6-phosphate etherase
MLNKLTTEARNPDSQHIDELSPIEIVRLMNAEDARVAAAVACEVESIARAVDVIAERIRSGGRLIYIGAGTSGRLGVLDAAECPPTFSTPPELVVGLIAGGYSALTRAIEGAEDRPETAVTDLQAIGLAASDVLVGIATSGRTPYVIGGLRHARGIGAFTIGFSCNDDSELASECDLVITPVVGPEVISGSTRLKAGTATKMVLNMLTTGAMVRLGKTYGNLMVDLRATNSKLLARSKRIVAELTGLSESEAEAQLQRCGGELKTAVVAQCRAVPPDVARRTLESAGGHLRAALQPTHAIEISLTPVQSPRVGREGGGDDHARGNRVAPHSMTYVLGVDGGGTKTVAWLGRAAANGGVEVIGRGSAGPSNPRSVGLDQALASIDAAVVAAFVAAGLERRPVRSACLAVAGAGRDAERRALSGWAGAAGLAERIAVVHDAEPLLASSPRPGVGVALVAGTGSFAFARNERGETARVGGWGCLFGDEGSGYAIGVAALRAAARSTDGRGPHTALVDALLKHLGLATPQELVAAVYERASDRGRVASLAPLVLSVADTGDAVADAILTTAAHDLAGHVAPLVATLRFDTASFPLVLSGGLLIQGHSVRQRVLSAIATSGLTAEIVQVPEPVHGALLLAANKLEDSPICGPAR